MKSILAQLEALGLSENEVKVYLAALELGSATAQELAGKAAVVRPTAYVAIGGLTKRGLMSSFTKGKKKYFTAEKPAKLLKLVQEEKRKLADHEEKLKRVMPELEALISLSADKPEVKYYEGLEGLARMHENIFESKTKEIKIIASAESVREVIPEEMRVLHNLRVKKAGIKGRILVVHEKKFEKPQVDFKNWEYKTLKKNHLNMSGEIAIFGEYLSLISYQDKPYGFLVKSKDIAETARILFDLAWSSDNSKHLRY